MAIIECISFTCAVPVLVNCYMYVKMYSCVSRMLLDTNPTHSLPNISIYHVHNNRYAKFQYRPALVCMYVVDVCVCMRMYTTRENAERAERALILTTNYKYLTF